MSEETGPQLNLSDLVFVLQTIQLASSRGAFKPEEFTAVGACYERLFAFLEVAGAVKSEASAQPEQTHGN